MRVKAVINLENYIYNLKTISKKIPISKIMCIIKANAYGHGSKIIYLESINFGIKNYGVATLKEALYLKKINKDTNILILGPISNFEIKRAIENNIEITISSFEEIEYILSNNLEKEAKIHLAFDTGMGRIGFNENNIEKAIDLIKPYGLFSHLSSADTDEEYTKKQIEKFEKVHKKYNGIIKNFHILNSFGSENNKLEYDIYRLGIILFGAEINDKYKPVMSLKARVSYIKKLEKDSFIGYSKTYKALKNDIIATLSVGYADGIFRSMSNKSKVFFKGKYYKIIGNICMDQMMILADNDLKVGDYVEIFGENIKINDLAKELGTISYELLCRISYRVKRVYERRKLK